MEQKADAVGAAVAARPGTAEGFEQTAGVGQQNPAVWAEAEKGRGDNFESALQAL
jgi:hypothetical protein